MTGADPLTPEAHQLIRHAVVERFTPGQPFNEERLNAALRAAFPADNLSWLRVQLMEHRYLERTADGSWIRPVERSIEDERVEVAQRLGVYDDPERTARHREVLAVVDARLRELGLIA